ncbi:TonB-dependent receptor [Sphingomonas sp. XXL09]|uniref:TonB-dependent receptor n=1 Tax=Sphingomonas sp. XXL09 TaxID=3457787 RepID=UPI00406BA861
MKRLVLACGISTLALTASAAGAQQIGPAATVPPQSKQQTADTPTDTTVAESNSAAQAATGDIIVTATRNETLASKTPIALTAITGDALLSAGITNPTTLGEQVPNLSIDRGNGLQITIRGVTSTDGTEKGDPSAAFMIDGIYIARPQTQEVSFFDVARVEVLRGPQGTLFGRNTTAGLINVITNHPVDRFEASLDAAYGNYDSRLLTGMINVPVTGELAVRAAFNYDRRDSFIQAGPRVRSDLDPFRNNVSGRLSAAWNSGPAKLLVVADYSHVGGQTINGVPAANFYRNFNTNGVAPIYAPVAGKDAQRTLNVPVTTPLGRDNDIYGVLADFTYDFGPVQLNYLGSYRKFERREDLTLIPASGATVYPARDDAAYRQNSQELRLSGTFGPLAVQIGGYYFHETGFQNYYIFGLLNPTVGAPGYTFGFPQRYVRSESLAGFGQATLSLTDRLRLTGGARYSHDNKKRLGATVICRTVACGAAGDSISANDAERNFSKVTWRAGLDYDLNTRSLLYAVVSTGYKAGGFNDGCEIGTGPGCTVTANALYYNPETITSYEAGLKTRLVGNALRVNLSAFHYDFKGIQLSQLSTICGGPCQVTTNAGKAKVDGVELETVANPGPHTRFDASASWLNARYTDFFPTPTVSFAGRKLDRSPEWTVTAGITQTIPLAGGGDIQAAARTRLSDSYYLAALGTLNQFRQPSFTKTDLTLTYNAPANRWYVQGFVRNVENSLVVSTAGSGTYASVQLQDPRTYGVRTGFRF